MNTRRAECPNGMVDPQTSPRKGSMATNINDASGHGDRSRMLGFAQRWNAYGGGDVEDIMVEFGISETEYFTRLQHILADAPELVDEPTRHAINAVATTDSAEPQLTAAIAPSSFRREHPAHARL
jgi:hypothetical protein